MDWYDTYRTTKINYYLIDLSLLLAPFLYFYIKSTTSPDFKLRNIKYGHFLPISIYLALKVFILIYDSAQPGFREVQNGYLVVNFEWRYLNPILFLVSTSQMLLYLAFSFQLLHHFKLKVKSYFANTYKLELYWLHTFLIAYSILYVFNSLQTVVNEVIVDLSWTQEWWYYLLSGVAIIYVGIKGYFTKLTEFQNVDFTSFEVPSSPQEIEITHPQYEEIERKKTKLSTFLKENKPFLDPELTLANLADQVDMSREELSKLINQGFHLRFNDFINGYRIAETKRLLAEGRHESLSMLGLAYEAGFNSKATFNRAFKKSEHQSPSEYLESQSRIKK